MKPYHLYNVRQYAVAINSEDKFLALQLPDHYPETGGKWTLPGGKMEAHDQPRGGLKREVKEESGLDVNINFPCHTGLWSTDAVSKYAVFYLCEVENAESLKISSEHSNHEWVSLKELKLHEFFNPTFAQAIKKAYELRKKLAGKKDID